MEIKDKKKWIRWIASGVYNMDFKQLFGLYIYAWKPIFSFHDNGAPMTMFISFQYSKPEKPEGYSKVAVQRILSSFEPEGTETMAMDQKPIIIAIMKSLRRTSRRGE